MSTGGRHAVVDPFCFRQFPLSHADRASSYGGAKITMTCEDFESVVNGYIDSRGAAEDGGPVLEVGYAPFCKHVFIPNSAPSGGGFITDSKINTIEITPGNEHLLRTEYEARNEKELPVLTRFFPKEKFDTDVLPQATWLDVILYSREQIKKENAAMGDEPTTEFDDVPWGIVSVKPQGVSHELPMNPITAMRNALGEEHGGSGKEIDRDEYQKAVDFWTKHAIVK